MASGSVDVDDGDAGANVRKTCGFNDMGDSCKYTVKKNDPTVDMCKRLFAFDARAVSIAAVPNLPSLPRQGPQAPCCFDIAEGHCPLPDDPHVRATFTGKGQPVHSTRHKHC